ncbi:MAG: histidine phosphatase family protein [Rhodospirillaceae bacterium]|nr:histidine phosphatase family protein [Rhodospirillaceae bacterium]
MTVTVLLVRHGAHALLGRRLVGRMAGVGLAPEGRVQAARLADRLAAERPAALQTSPLRRARETAAPIALRLGLPAQVVPALDEIDFGDWTGLDFTSLEGDPLWRQWNTERAAVRPPGGETVADVQRRVMRHIEETRRTHPGAAVAMVSHGDVIKAAVACCLGLDADAFARFEVSPAGVTRLSLDDDGGARLLALNEPCPAPPGPVEAWP